MMKTWKDHSNPVRKAPKPTPEEAILEEILKAAGLEELK